MADKPIEFWFVGPLQIQIPKSLQADNRVKLFGVVSRPETVRFYRKADLFIFPTLSDGFGLTQLEAQSWKLPVIASPYCGEVVQNNFNGLVLTDVCAESVATVLLDLLLSPKRLRTMSDHSRVSEEFSLESLGSSLIHS